MNENILEIKVGQVKPPKSPEELRDEFLNVIESYKASNKYKVKLPELMAKLAKLEAACEKVKKPDEAGKEAGKTEIAGIEQTKPAESKVKRKPKAPKVK
jgi:hypothetical protein